ncbi:MAG: porin [Zoogloeaceae bacterium]|jgi:predicted porin|nr:porin [Zoogloeaceae bacterium]
MRKKILALALTAASCTASAQSNLVVYGLIDVGFSRRGDNIASGVSPKNSIDDSLSTGSRIGFKGAEHLGGGVKAFFTLESGFAADTGQQRQSGRLFGRQAFFGLTGNFGTVTVGRVHTPRYLFLTAIDPFRGGRVGSYRNAISAPSALTAGGENLLDPIRLDNAIAYTSPAFSGFNITTVYSANALLEEHEGNKHDNTVFAFLPRYVHGPLDLGVSYHQIRDSGKGAGVNGLVRAKITNGAVGGAYDFGAFTLSAFHDYSKATAEGIRKITLKAWLVGLHVPFGNHAVQISYLQSHLNDGHDLGKAKQWAAGYTYAISKRAEFYAASANIKNAKKNGVYTRKASVGDAFNPGGGYQRGVQFGLKYSF